MPLFGKDKKAEVKKDGASVPVATAANVSANTAPDSSHVLLKPRITEKATMHEAAGVYTFDVAETANKHQISQAVRELYKVTPRMVKIVPVPSKFKRSARTGKRGVKRGGKKAYVYLKKGDTLKVM
ncbi:MAG: 50S ribosomal protein L23 [Patescibacteria group bacterium]